MNDQCVPIATGDQGVARCFFYPFFLCLIRFAGLAVFFLGPLSSVACPVANSPTILASCIMSRGRFGGLGIVTTSVSGRL